MLKRTHGGADSIDIELGTTSVDFDPRTESAICHSGKACYILADSSKFTIRPYIDKVVKLSEIDYIVTDNGIDEKFMKAMENADVELIIGK